jgi:hypothetical protein
MLNGFPHELFDLRIIDLQISDGECGGTRIVSRIIGSPLPLF